MDGRERRGGGEVEAKRCDAIDAMRKEIIMPSTGIG